MSSRRALVVFLLVCSAAGRVAAADNNNDDNRFDDNRTRDERDSNRDNRDENRNDETNNDTNNNETDRFDETNRDEDTNGSRGETDLGERINTDDTRRTSRYDDAQVESLRRRVRDLRRQLNDERHKTLPDVFSGAEQQADAIAALKRTGLMRLREAGLLLSLADHALARGDRDITDRLVAADRALEAVQFSGEDYRLGGVSPLVFQARRALGDALEAMSNNDVYAARLALASAWQALYEATRADVRPSY